MRHRHRIAQVQVAHAHAEHEQQVVRTDEEIDQPVRFQKRSRQGGNNAPADEHDKAGRAVPQEDEKGEIEQDFMPQRPFHRQNALALGRQDQEGGDNVPQRRVRPERQRDAHGENDQQHDPQWRIEPAKPLDHELLHDLGIAVGIAVMRIEDHESAEHEEQLHPRGARGQKGEDRAAEIFPQPEGYLGMVSHNHQSGDGPNPVQLEDLASDPPLRRAVLHCGIPTRKFAPGGHERPRTAQVARSHDARMLELSLQCNITWGRGRRKAALGPQAALGTQAGGAGGCPRQTAAASAPARRGPSGKAQS